MLPIPKVQLGELLSTSQLINELLHNWHWVFVPDYLSIHITSIFNLSFLLIRLEMHMDLSYA